MRDADDASYVPSPDKEGGELKNPTLSFLASDYSSEEEEDPNVPNDNDVLNDNEPPKKRGKKLDPHSHMFNVMKQQSKKQPVPVFSTEEACTELLNFLESLGEKIQCKQIIGSGKLGCNCLKIIKNNMSFFVEAIGGFLLKWLDMPKVEQDQHLLTSYIYAEAAKESAGKVFKRTFFYQVPYDSCACNDKEADMSSLRNHYICHHAFARIHNVA